MSTIAHPTTTGLVKTGHQKVLSVYVTAGADAAAVTLVDSADGTGTPNTIAVVKAAINTTVQVRFSRADASKGIYVSAISGTTPDVGVEYE